jgi:hypothetical protein
MPRAAGTILSTEDSREAMRPRNTIVNMVVQASDPNAFRSSRSQALVDAKRIFRR